MTIGFNQTIYTVSESGGEVLLFVAVLEGSLERSVTVRFATIPDSATETGAVTLNNDQFSDNSDNPDYEGTVVLLAFQPGTVSLPVSVPIVHDAIMEGNETFFAELDPQGQPVISDQDMATILILDYSKSVVQYMCIMYLSKILQLHCSSDNWF